MRIILYFVLGHLLDYMATITHATEQAEGGKTAGPAGILNISECFIVHSVTIQHFNSIA